MVGTIYDYVINFEVKICITNKNINVPTKARKIIYDCKKIHLLDTTY